MAGVIVGWGVVASSLPDVATGCGAVTVGKEAVSVAAAVDMAVVGVAVAARMVVASAGGGVGETAVSCSGAQATRPRKRKQVRSVTCLTNRLERI
jgi:hypothetical protein